MVDAGERAIRAAILRGEASDDDCTRLVDQFAVPLLRKIQTTFYFWTFSSNDQDCEDVLQNTYFKIFEKLHQCDPDKPLLPWAKTIAQREVINVLRERGKQQRIARGSTSAKQGQQTVSQKTEEPAEAYLQEPEQSELEQLEAWEIEELEGHQEEDEEARGSYSYDYGDNAELAANRKSEIFRNELALLSDSEQTIIIEHCQNGRTLVDLALEFGTTDVAMRKRANRARQRLFERLVQYEEFKNLKKRHESAARQKR